jgi:hypothetical protein
MGWFGCGAYLGGPMRARVGCIVSVEPAQLSVSVLAFSIKRCLLPALSGVQWLVDVFRGEVRLTSQRRLA